MKIFYLGTGAYDAIPSLFCNCDTCKRARALGGRNIRSRSQVIVNDDLLIDFNADTVAHFLQYNLDFNNIHNCLITHSHSDHFYPDDMVIAQYARKAVVMDYYLGEDGYNQAKKLFSETKGMEGKYHLHLVKPNDYFSFDKYHVIAAEAVHEKHTSPMVFGIDDGEKRLLYVHDTSTLKEESVDTLTRMAPYDLISFDCTGGIVNDEWPTHMTLKQVLNEIEVFKAKGIIKDSTKIVLSHFSHNGQGNYDDMVEATKGTGIIIAYDGLVIEF